MQFEALRDPALRPPRHWLSRPARSRSASAIGTLGDASVASIGAGAITGARARVIAIGQQAMTARAGRGASGARERPRFRCATRASMRRSLCSRSITGRTTRAASPSYGAWRESAS
jgi:hypothetical protein